MRNSILAAAILWLAPVLTVGAMGLGLPLAAALAVGAPLALAAAVPGSRRLASALNDDRPAPRLVHAALMVAAAVAILRIGSVSVFMADVNRQQFSVEPHDPFRLVHSCMSAYEEAARFCSEGTHNIYERELYRPGGEPRAFGPLRADPFHYPPPFLLLPQALRVAAPDFWDFRRLWFALQALMLAVALVGLAGWIGGRRGLIALLGGVALLALPHPVATLQQGNFQITAGPLAVLAFLLLVSGRRATGGGLLAYAALGKIFPGVLAVPLLAARRWRDLAWLGAAGAVLLALTIAVQGTRPMRDFVGTALPEISSGAAFPQTESPPHARVNFSAYGQTVRLRLLGIPWLTQPRGLMVVQIYGVLVIAFAVWAGWRMRFNAATAEDRIALMLLALGIVGLASFRSPFVGGVYGVFSTLWIAGLLAAGAATAARSGAWIALQILLALAIWVIPSPAGPPSDAWLWISGALMFASMAVNVWAVVAAVRHSARDKTQPTRRSSGIKPRFAIS